MINAVLVKEVAVLVRDVSIGGCLLRSRIPLPVGAVGTLAVHIQGELRVEWFRIARADEGDRRGEARGLGAEFLPLRVPGPTSVRGALARVDPLRRGRGMPGPAGRSSGDPGKSPGVRGRTGGTPPLAATPAAQDSAHLSRSVVEFARLAPRVDDGSAVAQLGGTDAPVTRESGKGEVHMKSLFARLVRDDQGQDLIEYVLIGTLVSIAVIAGAGALGTNLNTWYQNMATWVNTQATTGPLAP
jgi:pilus assembly protein Flp/PilA